jgi:hypothetical protein
LLASRLMNSDDFTRFLELLSSTNDGEDGGSCYIRLYRKLEGFFTMKGVRDPVGAAAETVDIAVRKVAEGTPIPNAEKYCMGIARNIAKVRLRKERREAKAFLEFIEDLDNDSDEQVARINQMLKPCFELLAAEDQEMLVAYCQVWRGRARAEHRRELAARMKTTVPALRMRATRLRKELTDCVGKRSEDR